jgi:hypothetical protein
MIIIGKYFITIKIYKNNPVHYNFLRPSNIFGHLINLSLNKKIALIKSAMNKYVIAIALLTIVTTLNACSDGEADNMQHIETMRDSIFKTFPTVAGITIRVNDGQHLHITVGDAHLYGASDAVKQQEANQMGLMAIRIFSKNNKQNENKMQQMLQRIFGNGDNTLHDGKLTITKNEHTEEEDPADGITININLDSLRKSKV